VVRIQREFLWGGVGRGKKINWVKWKTVCQEKENGGVGVKDIRVMNISLLAKWRWRLLDGEKALWKSVLVKKYGENVESVLQGSNMVWPRHSSLWWKDVVKLGDFGSQDWFNQVVMRKVGNGMSTSFWNDRWKGENCFHLKYPRLDSVSNQKEALVGEVRDPSDLRLVWRFLWRRNLFMWEEELILSLKKDLEGIVWTEEEDVWRWSLEDMGTFMVKSAYKRMEDLVLKENRWRAEEKRVFKHLWKIPVPTKVVAFVWKTLLDKIPTMVNLALRNVLPTEGSMLCALCARMGETSLHLFLHCNLASSVWLHLMSWLDYFFPIPPNLFSIGNVGGRGKK